MIPPPVFLVAGLVNILAKQFNYNIDTTNPNMDIRVRRSLQEPEIFPEVLDDVHTKEVDVPTSLLVNKLKIKPVVSRPKRTTHMQTLNNGPYENRNNGPYENRNNDPFEIKNNGPYENRNNGPYENRNNGNDSIRWKTKPNFFVRTYNAIASSVNPTTRKPNIASYGNNGEINNKGYNYNGYNDRFTNNQNGLTTTNTAAYNNGYNYNAYDRPFTNNQNGVSNINTAAYSNGNYYSGNNDRTFTNNQNGVSTDIYNNGYNYNPYNDRSLTKNQNGLNTNTPTYNSGINYDTQGYNNGNNYNDRKFTHNETGVIKTNTAGYNNGNNTNGINDKHPYGNNDNGKIRRIGRKKKTGANTTETVNAACIFCVKSDCGENQYKSDGVCVDIEYNYE